MDNEKNNETKSKIKLFAGILLASLVLTFIFNMLIMSSKLKADAEIDYSTAVEWVEKGMVQEIVFEADRINIELTVEAFRAMDEPGYYQKKYYTGYISDPEFVELLKEKDVQFSSVIPTSSPIMDFFMGWIFPIILLYGFFILISRVMMKKFGGGFMGVNKSNAKLYVEKGTGVTFDDVAGQDEAKESLEEIIDYLHNPEKYAKIGAKQPKGALLVGPPGTGKTLLAKAVAGEADVAFLSISGSDFEEMFVGVGASRVRDLFKQAQDNAPCIVFIDEIDAVGKKRDTEVNSSNDQTLNQLLSEMDGFDTSNGIVILAATNRPEILDKALLRAGRFDRRIIVETPDLIGRENILKVHSKDVIMEDNVDLHQIALATSGAVGADLANMVNEAALRAVRLGRDKVNQEDLMEAVEVVIAGKEKKDRILSEKEKRIVAFHEVGHALAAALQKNTQPVQKITIVPRTMGALGYTMQMPEEESYLNSKSEIMDQLVVMLAGRSAEEIEFGEITTGASNDIERATAMARSMISQFGMSKRFDMMALESVQNRYLDGRAVANCSETTLAELDNEVLRVIKEAHEKAKALLKENHEALRKISEYLIEKENITGETFMKLLKNEEPEKKEDSDK